MRDSEFEISRLVDEGPDQEEELVYDQQQALLEAAEILGVGVKALESLLSRAREFLRSELSDKGRLA